MSNKTNISIFIPHVGCPHACSFCDQRVISGTQTPPTGKQVTELLTKAVARLSEKKSAEIAFFGGSFTAIDRSYMIELLAAACPFVGQKGIRGIRISTRPDGIDRDVLAVLKDHCVTSIELGAQSTDDVVLRKNRRGHTAQDIMVAARLIKQTGFSLGLQMMTGLYGATEQSDRQTALDLLALCPDMVRIYPTITLPQTELYQLYEEGLYTPPTLEETVALCSELLDLFEQQGVPVIRLGLHGDPAQLGGIGPCHPALRELCEGARMLNKALSLLPEHARGVLIVNVADISKMVGQKKCNLERLTALGHTLTIRGDASVPKGQVRYTAEM